MEKISGRLKVRDGAYRVAISAAGTFCMEGTYQRYLLHGRSLTYQLIVIHSDVVEYKEERIKKKRKDIIILI